MLTQSFMALSGLSLLLALSGVTNSAFAETGHCNYQLYSKATDHSLQVCQTAESPSQCGRLLRRNYDQKRAHAIRKKGQKHKFVTGDCSYEAVVGICSLPHSRIFFYEGDTEELATGCDQMKGHWDVMRL